MGYSLPHYIRHFPVRYYLTGGLLRLAEPLVGLYLGSTESAVLVSRKQQNYGFETEICGLPDAPPLIGSGGQGQSSNRSFSAKLLARARVRGSPRFLFIPELGVNDFYCNMHSVTNLREINGDALLESLDEEPRQVIGSWDEIRLFRWELLTPSLEPLRGAIDRRTKQLMIVGIPGDYCEQCESWSDQQFGSLLSIVPAPLAVLKWFCSVMPTGAGTAFLLVKQSESLLLAVVQSSEVILVRMYAQDFETAFREIPFLAEELGIEQPEIFVWSAGPLTDSETAEMRGTRLAGTALRQLTGEIVVFRQSDGSQAEAEAPIAYLLQWLGREAG
jgi:hypothetical protein